MDGGLVEYRQRTGRVRMVDWLGYGWRTGRVWMEEWLGSGAVFTPPSGVEGSGDSGNRKGTQKTPKERVRLEPPRQTRKTFSIKIQINDHE